MLDSADVIELQYPRVRLPAIDTRMLRKKTAHNLFIASAITSSIYPVIVRVLFGMFRIMVPRVYLLTILTS